MQYAVLVLPVLVAASQLYFSKRSDLTSWKGGGFGMYSEPHPNSSRTVWLEGRTDGSATVFRIFPADKRVDWIRVKDGGLIRRFKRLRAIGSAGRNFPSLMALDELKETVESILKRNVDRWSELDIFPREELRIKVLQVQISADFERLEAKTITDREL